MRETPGSTDEGSPLVELAARLLETRDRGGDVEAFLRRHGEHADVLREVAAQAVVLERHGDELASDGPAGARALTVAALRRIADDAERVEEPGQHRDAVSEVLARSERHAGAWERYALEGELARGGQGAILAAFDGHLERRLAMKVALASDPGDDGAASTARSLGRFLEEAQVTAQLDHPGIVPVHDLGLGPDRRVYFTMKLVKGKTLWHVFDELERGEGGWTQTRVLGLIQKVCDAMSYAHAKGVIHRDLKPGNVMVGSYGEVYVMDWGLARVLGRDDERDIRPRADPALLTSEIRSERRDRSGSTPDMSLMTMDGTVVGTPAYMAPEQARGDLPAIGPHSDVYAVGAMLYHLLAGQMPYVPRDARLNNYAVWQRVQEGPPRPLHEVAPGVPAELAAICERAMAREVSARYTDMSALADDLSAYVEGRVVAAYETGAWAETRKWVRRNKPLAASLAAALVLLVAGLATALVLRQQALDNAELAERNEGEAKKQEGIAKSNELIARKRADDILSLSAFQKLEDLETEAAKLWPPHPEHLRAYEVWVDKAAELVAGLDADPTSDDIGHRARLEALRARAQPFTEADREAAQRAHPRFGEIEVLSGRDAVEAVTGAHGEKRIAELEQDLATLEAEASQQREWRFEDEDDRWWHNQLALLVEEIAAFVDPETGPWKGISPEHGWGIERRRAFAADVEERTVTGSEAAESWTAAAKRVAANAKYAGVMLTPQLGLVPLGPDPGSGLEEFGHPLTGTVPERDDEGRLVVTEDMGLVFVLLPGGSFWRGAQSGDRNAQNYDPHAESFEGPVHEVALSPFFLSKYEMTQAQWERFVGENPSNYRPGNFGEDPDRLALLGRFDGSLLHPVEQVTWWTSRDVCERMGLSLPTEAQWECGARGGTTTIWWTGNEAATLGTQKAANLADRTRAKEGSRGLFEPWDDGYSVHAPVGTFAPNPFGLYNILGNVSEWCLDGYDSHDQRFYGRPKDRDPLSDPSGSLARLTRGGSYGSPAVFARSASRFGRYKPEVANRLIGLRPARALRAP